MSLLLWPRTPDIAPALRLQVLDLSKQQEITKQAEAREREADYRRQAAQLEKVRWVI